MPLQEREGFLNSLRTNFEKVVDGEGHTVFISGEAGIGKTSLVREFGRGVKADCLLLQGTCDALFTPRPLAPVFDILLQLQPEGGITADIGDRTRFFSQVFMAIGQAEKPIILIFEDVHWADEASIDFIKFLARRIAQVPCLFLLTLRDNETDHKHPLSAIPGQLSPDNFTHLRLLPLSPELVTRMSEQKGFNGAEVFSISGGNPFYVNEILASYSTGVPEKIKDSILSVFNRQDVDTGEAWKFLSVLPQGLPLEYSSELDPALVLAMEKSLGSRILVVVDDRIRFKHELYRRTIEVSLSPLLRIALNRKMLAILLKRQTPGSGVEQIIHFAKNANESDTVLAFAPAAAKRAAELGAHIEASRLYLSAIEYYSGADPKQLTGFYEAYAYECYLTNRITEAIIYTGKAYTLWKESGDQPATGNALRFLSRLWWYGGNQDKAGKFGLEAIELFSQLPASPEKALAYSNMSQLKMLSDDLPGCLHWGGQAIAMAGSIGDRSTLCHALNNVGTAKMMSPAGRKEGEEMLRQSLQIALDSGFQEHAARAYTNLGSNTLFQKEYALSASMLSEGIRFCEERDLDSWSVYMWSLKARLCLETGLWDESRQIASRLLENEHQAAVSKIIALTALGTLLLRTGNEASMAVLLEALTLAEATREPQRVIPALAAIMEWEWTNGAQAVTPEHFDELLAIARASDDLKQDELAFWLLFCKGIAPVRAIRFPGYQIETAARAKMAAGYWKKSGNRFQQALCLVAGTEADKRAALELLQDAGAIATAEKLKRTMRVAGIKNIPRGLRKSTRENPSRLTGREMELLPLIQEGLQNKEIAARLFISPKTVDHHISSIYFKLDVKTRAGAVREARRLSILK